jgi:hydrogenase maturation protease
MPDRHEHSHGIDTAEHLAEHLCEVLTARSAIVCVGNELNGDDGAGPEIARRMSGRVRWSVFDVRNAPENFLMKIVEAAPDTVLLIDALSFDADPGSIELFAAEAVTGQGPSTHGPAPIAFLDILNMMQPCRRVVLGIQPARIDPGQEMSGPVAKAVDLVCEALIKAGGTDPRQAD